MENQDKINVTLNLSSKNITDDNNIFKELISSYPNVVNLDLSDNQLTYLPEDLSLLSKIQFLDIQGNNFNDVNRILFIINFIFL
jgi:Leucine-rich repeat (LRR) protein